MLSLEDLHSVSHALLASVDAVAGSVAKLVRRGRSVVVLEARLEERWRKRWWGNVERGDSWGPWHAAEGCGDLSFLNVLKGGEAVGIEGHPEDCTGRQG